MIAIAINKDTESFCKYLVAALLPPKTEVVRKFTHMKVISRMKMSRKLWLKYLKEVAPMEFRIYIAI